MPTAEGRKTYFDKFLCEVVGSREMYPVIAPERVIIDDCLQQWKDWESLHVSGGTAPATASSTEATPSASTADAATGSAQQTEVREGDHVSADDDTPAADPVAILPDEAVAAASRPASTFAVTDSPTTTTAAPTTEASSVAGGTSADDCAAAAPTTTTGTPDPGDASAAKADAEATGDGAAHPVHTTCPTNSQQQGDTTGLLPPPPPSTTQEDEKGRVEDARRKRDQKARNATQKLIKDLAKAGNSATAIGNACHAYRETDTGKEVQKQLLTVGIANIPYGETEDDALNMARIVRDSAKKLVLGDRPHRDRIMIKGQTRYGLETRYMGGDTISVFQQIAEALAAVLRAVVDGASPGVVSHKHLALANAKGTGKQMWHRDGHAKKVLSKTDRSHMRKKTRTEPHPFSAVCAFQEDTVLHVVEGSHNQGEEMDFSEWDAHVHKIPNGWSAAFFSILVHHGMGTEGEDNADNVHETAGKEVDTTPRENIRGHMYLTVVGCTLPPFGMIETQIKGPSVK